VDPKNLWPGFRALAEALRGVAVDREGFEPLDLSTSAYWCLVLRGRTVSLAWLRNKADRWDHVLRDGETPAEIASAALDGAALGLRAAAVELFRPWPADGTGAAVVTGSSILLPAFRHGLICRLRHGAPGRGATGAP